MAIVLVILRTDKPESRQEVSVSKKMVIGHSVYCDVKLDDKIVSNMQCEIQTTKSGHVIVTNLDLKKEVYLNEVRLKRSSIKAADVLKIGPFVLNIDQSRLTPEEIIVMNSEYIEYC